MKLIDKFFSKAIERRINDYQSDLLKKHYNEVENMYRQVRGWRHDYHNHIQILNAYIELNQIDKVKDYLKKLETDLETVDTVVKTGNIMVDAILNSKLSYIKSKNIPINVKVTVPQNINVEDIDLCVIIGNLLDNAAEACMKSKNVDKSYIRIYIGILKGQLYITVTNPVNSSVKKLGNKFLSTKNSKSHGFGLSRVDNVVKKYNGYINRQCEANIFVTEIMLPLEH